MRLGREWGAGPGHRRALRATGLAVAKRPLGNCVLGVWASPSRSVCGFLFKLLFTQEFSWPWCSLRGRRNREDEELRDPMRKEALAFLETGASLWGCGAVAKEPARGARLAGRRMYWTGTRSQDRW
jgi:hypothetical protein